MKVEAISHGTGRIIAINGKGSAFALNLDVKVRVRLLEEKEIIGDSLEIETAKKILNFFNYDYGFEIETENNLPESIGRKEAVSSAVTLAIVGALARIHGSINELRIDKFLSEQFFVIDKKLVDKQKLMELCSSEENFDRISASFYGGFCITDNREKRILRRGEMENLCIVILIPERFQKDDLSLFQDEAEMIWNEALKGNLYDAMKLNSLLYSAQRRVIDKMLNSGALTVNISDGALMALIRDKSIEPVRNSVSGNGSILIAKTANQEARVLGKPKRIMKLKEFLELKKDQEFHFL